MGLSRDVECVGSPLEGIFVEPLFDEGVAPFADGMFVTLFPSFEGGSVKPFVNGKFVEPSLDDGFVESSLDE